MERPVGEHTRKLEEYLTALNQHVMENALNREDRNRIESEIRVVNLALSQYRTAFRLEQSIFLSK